MHRKLKKGNEIVILKIEDKKNKIVGLKLQLSQIKNI